MALIAGFFSPVEALTKASFPTELSNGALVWIPQAADDKRDPDLSIMAGTLRRWLEGGKSMKVLHARPHSPEYSAELAHVLGKARNVSAAIELVDLLDLNPRDFETVRRELCNWFGEASLNKLPTAEMVREFQGEDRLVCVSHRDHHSFAAVFKAIGISRQQFSTFATEIRVSHLSKAEFELAGILGPKAPLLLAFRGFHNRPSRSMMAQFLDRKHEGERALEAALAYFRELQAYRDRRELIEARASQMSLLPPVPCVVDGLQIHCKLVQCKSVGGDFYDFFPLATGSYALVVADVQGKGHRSAFVGAQARSIIRSSANDGYGPLEIASRLHREMSQHEQCSVDLFCGFYCPTAKELTYYRAGQVRALVRRTDGTIEELASIGLSPGYRLPESMFAGRMEPLEKAKLSMAQTECLLVFSDGVAEAEFDGLVQRLHETKDLGAEQRVGSMFSFKADNTEEDDATLMLVALR